MARIADKIDEIGKYLNELKGIVPKDIEKYKNNIEKKAACERYVEKIMEAATDLAFMIIKNKKFRIPEDDADAFNILSENNIIDKDLASRLKDAKGMKNIISHQYMQVDDRIVFEAITEELENDIVKFIDCIERVI